METILITGGSGLIGQQLTSHLLAKGYQVIILTRKMPVSKVAAANTSYALWSVENKTIDAEAIRNCDYIIHLAGAGVVDKKWTDAYQAEIVKSRTESSALLIDALQKNPHKVKAVVSASAVGWYGEDPSRGKDGFIETDPADNSFLGETCKLWEQSIDPVQQLGIRLVKLRTGIVLSNEGGALVEFKKPTRFGIAGILGSGKQVVSWIHIEDLCRMYTEAITNEQLTGSYNAVAPQPVSNKELTMQLATHLKGKFYIPVHVPAVVLKIMLGTRSVEVLKSTTVSCKKITLAGYKFLFPTLNDALLDLCKR